MKIPSDIIAKIQAKELTNRAAAKSLGISESWFSHLLTKQGVIRPPSPHVKYRQDRHELLQARKELHRQLADAVKRKTKTLAQAAKEGNCSQRTIYRVVTNT